MSKRIIVCASHGDFIRLPRMEILKSVAVFIQQPDGKYEVAKHKYAWFFDKHISHEEMLTYI